MWYYWDLWSLIIIWSLTLPITNIICHESTQETTGMAKTAFVVTNFTCQLLAPPGLYDDDDRWPSVLHDLRLDVTCGCEGPVLNISWAVKVDATIDILAGIWISVSKRSDMYCIYHPPLNTVPGIGDFDLLWFSHTVSTEPGEVLVTAHNVPEDSFSEDNIMKHAKTSASGCTDQGLENHHKCRPTMTSTTDMPTSTVTALPASWREPNESPKTLMIVVASMLTVCLLIATGFSLYVFHCRASQSHRLQSKEACGGGEVAVRVPVLMVYPAVDGVFQRAVVTLADFLQGSGGCDVAVDVWQQGRLAQLGPLRWLHSLSESADKVLVVLPGNPTVLDESEKKLLPACQMVATVPASAHQLFPLALKILPLSKLWVVQLGKMSASRSSVPAELRGCESFSLLEDLQKLLARLRSPQKADGKGLKPTWLMRQGGRLGCNDDGGLGKLKEVLQQLQQWERSKGSRDPQIISV